MTTPSLSRPLPRPRSRARNQEEDDAYIWEKAWDFVLQDWKLDKTAAKPRRGIMRVSRYQQQQQHRDDAESYYDPMMRFYGSADSYEERRLSTLPRRPSRARSNSHDQSVDPMIGPSPSWASSAKLPRQPHDAVVVAPNRASRWRPRSSSRERARPATLEPSHSWYSLPQAAEIETSKPKSAGPLSRLRGNNPRRGRSPAAPVLRPEVDNDYMNRLLGRSTDGSTTAAAAAAVDTKKKPRGRSRVRASDVTEQPSCASNQKQRGGFVGAVLAPALSWRSATSSKKSKSSKLSKVTFKKNKSSGRDGPPPALPTKSKSPASRPRRRSMSRNDGSRLQTPERIAPLPSSRSRSRSRPKDTAPAHNGTATATTPTRRGSRGRSATRASGAPNEVAAAGSSNAGFLLLGSFGSNSSVAKTTYKTPPMSHQRVRRFGGAANSNYKAKPAGARNNNMATTATIVTPVTQSSMTSAEARERIKRRMQVRQQQKEQAEQSFWDDWLRFADSCDSDDDDYESRYPES